MPQDPEDKTDGTASPATPVDNEALLKQLRDDWSYHREYWRENYDESAKDMNCAAAIPPPSFVDDRKGQPCIWPDEISQYIKQFNNNLRQNKRSIKVSPKGEGARAKDAEHRQNYIRGIIEASKGQSIFTTAAESAAECAFGYWRVTTRVTGPKGEQEPRLRRIPNWRTVYPDPDALEADFSDQMKCFVSDTMRISTFARRYPKAIKKSFEGADRQLASGWFSDQNITVAEYWVREEIDQEDGEKRYKVTQYITNGLEILETNKWLGSWIPIIGVFGEELYVSNGSESKRIFMSLIRRARDSQQMLAYIASQEAAEFGMAPRAPYLVLEGTVDPDQWKDAHKTSTAFLLYKIPATWNPQWGPPPKPERVPFIPNAAAYESAYEQWRRSIQASMGNSPLPTSAQRQNQKSGIALEKIQNEQAVGSFHITDNFTRALENTGQQLDELITKLAETDSLPQKLLGKDQKDEDVGLNIAPSSATLPDQDPESEHLEEADQFFAHIGKFGITVSDGPNYQSQRDEASEFADTLLQTAPALGMPPAILQQILAIAVKLKNIGTYGDEIADLLSPPDPNKLSPQTKAILAQAQGHIQQLTQELQKLQLEKIGKVTETQGKLQIVQQQGQDKASEAEKDRQLKWAIAEITTVKQSVSERLSAIEDLMKQFHDQAHDVAMQKDQQAHEQGLAAQAAENQSAQSAQDAEQQQQAAQAQPQPEAGQ